MKRRFARWDLRKSFGIRRNSHQTGWRRRTGLFGRRFWSSRRWRSLSAWRDGAEVRRDHLPDQIVTGIVYRDAMFKSQEVERGMTIAAPAQSLEDFLPEFLPDLSNSQSALPAIAKDSRLMASID